MTRHREVIVKIRGPDQPARRLIYFPYAGGGVATIKPWLAAVPDDTQVLALRLPGREIRLQEKPLDSVQAVVDALCEPLLPFLDVPFAFLGHSVGALQAFELIRELRRLGRSQPDRLVVSGRRAPHLPSLTRHVHALPEDAFVEELRGYEGTPEIILRDRQVRAMFLPTIRADFKISEDYHHADEAPLDCPIFALGGTRDVMVPVPDLMAWERHSAAGFEGHLLQGGHFFQNSALAPVIGLLRAALSAGCHEAPARSGDPGAAVAWDIPQPTV